MARHVRIDAIVAYPDGSKEIRYLVGDTPPPVQAVACDGLRFASFADLDDAIDRVESLLTEQQLVLLAMAEYRKTDTAYANVALARGKTASVDVGKRAVRGT